VGAEVVIVDLERQVAVVRTFARELRHSNVAE
jgi:hypothetical protein